MRNAMESAWPRTTAASRLLSLRAGSGNRALPGARPGRSAANVTSNSGALAMARRHDVTARLNGSVGASFDPVRNFVLDVDFHLLPCPARPCERRDGSYESATFTEDSASSTLKQ